MRIYNFLYSCLFPYSRGNKTFFSTRISLLFNKINIGLYKLCHPYLLKKKVVLHGKPDIYHPENLDLGEGCSINGNVFINCMGGVSIGRNVTISHGVTILSTTLDSMDFDVVEKHKPHKHSKVIIGDGVWLCANVTILPGVSIAPRCIIAAGAVLTKSIENQGVIWGGASEVNTTNLTLYA